MKKNILTLIAIISIFSACTKDNEGTPGGSGEYQPLTVNSTWSYRNETTAEIGIPGVVDTTVNTMTATTKIFDGKTFHLLNSVTSGETEEGYIGFNNNIYTTRSVQEDEPVEFDYLDETKAAGYSSVTPLEVEDAEAQLKTTVVEKGINKTILGKAYSNVIHTKLETQMKQNGVFKTVAAVEFYIAKGVGIIAIYTSFNGNQLTKTELINVIIK
jgi:hypothetical protein